MHEVSGDFAVSSAPVNEATLKKEAGSELKEEKQGDEKIGNTDQKQEEDDAAEEEQDDDDDSLAARLVQDAEEEEQTDDEDGKTLALEKVSEKDEEQAGADSEDEEQEQDEEQDEDEDEDEDEDDDEEQSKEMLQYIKKRVAQMSPSVQSLFIKVEALSQETDKDVVSEQAEAAADKAHKEFGKTFTKESVVDVVSQEADAAADEAHQEFGKAFAKELGHPADELAEKFAEDREDQTDRYIQKRLLSMSPSVNTLYAKVEKLSKENQKDGVSDKAQEAEEQAFEEFSEAFAKELGVPMEGIETTVRKLAMEDEATASKDLAK